MRTPIKTKQKALLTEQCNSELPLVEVYGDNFYLLEFDAGVALVESFWLDMECDKHPYIGDLMQRLLTDVTAGYWNWFKKMKRHEDVMFLRDYRPVYLDIFEECGAERALKELKKEYRIHITALSEYHDAHNLLYKFLVNNKYLKLKI